MIGLPDIPYRWPHSAELRRGRSAASAGPAGFGVWGGEGTPRWMCGGAHTRVKTPIAPGASAGLLWKAKPPHGLDESSSYGFAGAAGLADVRRPSAGLGEPSDSSLLAP